MVDECSPPPAAIGVLEPEALEEDQNSEHVRVPDASRTFFRELFAQFLDRLLKPVVNVARDGIRRARFVIQTAFQGAIGSDERFERLLSVAIDRPGGFEDGFQQLRSRVQQQRFLIAQELLTYPNVLVRQLGGVNWGSLFAHARFTQVLAIQRTIHGHLALISAAGSADIAPHSRTMPARFSKLADDTFHVKPPWIISSYHWG